MKAQAMDVTNILIAIAVGNSKGIGNCVNRALCSPIVNPIIIPTIIPIKQLDNTRVYASNIYRRVILFLVIPTALSTAISFDYSIIFAVIEEIKLKKQRIITTTVITENTKLIMFYY